ncbi:MAG: hypothetical protein NVSMB4_06950 [Acidimicrobiales bacterium]
MTAFVFAIFLTALMSAIIYAWARRRPAGATLTWGEAFVAALFVFVYLVVIYGVLPNQWLQWCDGPLKWRSDKIGIPAGPIGWILHNNRKYLGFLPFDKNTFFPKGITFFGRGKIAFTAQDLRDIVAATIYIAAIVGHMKGWLWWQARHKKSAAATPELPTSAYGRPLVKKV